MIVSGAARPRLRLTRVHFAVLAFFGVCCVGRRARRPGAGEHGRGLARRQEARAAASYMLFFFIVASTMRPREVPRYAALMVVLGVIVAIATVVEYRLHYNVFYSLWGKMLPIDVPSELDMPGLDRPPDGLRAHQPAAGAGGAARDGAAVRRDRLDRRGARAAGGCSTRWRSACCSPAAWRPRARPASSRRSARSCCWWPTARARSSARWRGSRMVLGVLVHFTSPGALGSVLTQLEPGHVNNVLTHDRQDRPLRRGAPGRAQPPVVRPRL